MRKAIEAVPRISAGAVKILDLISHDDTTIPDLVKAVETESMLTARLLQIVNSPLYGFLSPVFTINLAIPLLGLRTVACIVLDECIGNMLQNRLMDINAKKASLGNMICIRLFRHGRLQR